MFASLRFFCRSARRYFATIQWNCDLLKSNCFDRGPDVVRARVDVLKMTCIEHGYQLISSNPMYTHGIWIRVTKHNKWLPCESESQIIISESSMKKVSFPVIAVVRFLCTLRYWIKIGAMNNLHFLVIFEFIKTKQWACRFSSLQKKKIHYFKTMKKGWRTKVDGDETERERKILGKMAAHRKLLEWWKKKYLDIYSHQYLPIE